AFLPNDETSAAVPAPARNANHSVWVAVRCPLVIRVSLRVLVSEYTVVETRSVRCARACETGPKLRASVLCGVSRSGTSAAPAVTPANTKTSVAEVAPPQATGRKAPIASPAPAPLIACVGPITMSGSPYRPRPGPQRAPRRDEHRAGPLVAHRVATRRSRF